MDMYSLTQLASLAGPVIAVGGVVYTWLTSRATQNSTEIKQLQERVAQAESSLFALKEAFKQVPDKDMVYGLDKRLTEQTGSLGILAESVKAIERTAHRIENFLLDQAKR